jgi:hypothetical protein
VGLLWVAVVVGGWGWLGGRAPKPVRCMRDRVRPLSTAHLWCNLPADLLAAWQVDLARTFTGYGLDLCLCDVDTVWINGAQRRAANGLQHAACRRRTSLVHALVHLAAPAWQTTTSTTRCLPALPTAPSYFLTSSKLQAPAPAPAPAPCCRPHRLL